MRGTRERAELVARLADRAKFIRLETVRLAEIPGAGHYTGTFSGRIHGLGYRVFCVAGDGELGEGQMWEAAMAAGHFELGSLVCIVDRNRLSIDGPTEDLMGIEPLAGKFASFRWSVQRMEGDVGRLAGADYDEVIAEIQAGLQPLSAGNSDA